MSDIHPTAIVSSKAELADDVTVGPWATIEADVVIGSGSRIGSNTLIAAGARLGRNVQVHHGAVIGTVPQDLKFRGEATQAVIGDGTVIREYATVNRGTAQRRETRIGEGCLIMAYAHVAHDCLVGNHVIMGNAATLAGHVEVHDYALLSGILPVHQFVKVGAHCIVGGGFRVPQDVCPYALAAGYPLRIVGLNVVGLKRRGFSTAATKVLRQAYKFLFFSGFNTSQAVDHIRNELELTPEIQTILEFIEHSHRGLIK